MTLELKELDRIAMGRRVRVMREARNLTREALAESLDISPQFVADIEYGSKGISIRTLFQLGQVLGVTSDYILGGRLFPADEDDEALKLSEDIMAMLRVCSASQLEDLRPICKIFIDRIDKAAKTDKINETK